MVGIVGWAIVSLSCPLSLNAIATVFTNSLQQSASEISLKNRNIDILQKGHHA